MSDAFFDHLPIASAFLGTPALLDQRQLHEQSRPLFRQLVRLAERFCDVDKRRRTRLAQKERFDAAVLKPRLFAALAPAEVNPTAASRFAPDAELGAFFDAIANEFYLPLAVCDAGSVDVASEGYGFWANRMTSKTHWRRSFDPKPNLKRLETPVLVIRGDCDDKKEDVARQFVSVFPNAQYLEIDRAGHMPFLERPDAYLSAVHRFLAQDDLNRE